MIYLKFKKNKAGFSLVEIVITLFIIAVGVFPVLSMFLSGTRTVERGGSTLEASIAAQNLLDLARSDFFLWQNIPREIEIPDPNFPQFELPEIFAERYNATAKVVLEQASGYTIPGTGQKERNLARITVKINWTENNVPREFRVLSYRANTNAVNLKTSSRFK